MDKFKYYIQYFTGLPQMERLSKIHIKFTLQVILGT